MTHSAAQSAKQTTLQRTLTSALNELGFDAALIAIYQCDDGPPVVQGYRGFSPREVQTIVRPLSLQELVALSSPIYEQSRSAAGRQPAEEGEGLQALRLRIITPTARSLLAVPLRYKQQPYGVLVVGRKESAIFTKKEKTLLETASENITSALERASLFDGTLIRRRPLVAQEPISPPPTEGPAEAPTYSTPEIQERALTLLGDANNMIGFDRAWIAVYDPVAGAVEVVGVWGEHKGEHRKDLKPGQRLALEASASGWCVRHRKPRLDHDLASTQGRFQDHKHLYRDRFRSALVVPFFVRGQVGGTVTLASKTPMQYSLADVRVLEPILVRMAELLQPGTTLHTPAAEGGPGGEAPAGPVPPQLGSEPLIRKQERETALREFSAFLATEVREPLASIRAQLEEVTGAGTLDFDTQTRIENAMRDLIRVEALLHEILDFAKPLELYRRLCRITEVIENALMVVATDLEVNRISVTKEYSVHLPPVRCDEGKMQHVFLSIFKNALEAMTPGGHLHIEVTPHRAGRAHEVEILIRNDGEPIPAEHLEKVFEPYFTTKRTGTGLGLATVKKIVEAHHGQISISSEPGQGTAVSIRLPAPPRSQHFRRRGRGRRVRR